MEMEGTPEPKPGRSSQRSSLPAGVAPAAREQQPLLGGSDAPQYQATAAEVRADDRDSDVPQASPPAPPPPSVALPAVEPPQRRGSFQERQQFQAARQETVRTAVLSRDSWRSPFGILILSVGVLLLLLPPIVIIYIEIKSWQVLIVYGDKPCDQDLVFWLLIRNLMILTAPRMPVPGEMDEEHAARQRVAARWAASVCTLWLVVGYIWTQYAVTCEHTNPGLFHWVRFLTLFGLLVHCLSVFFPLVLVLCAMAYHGMVARGWLKSPNAASDEAIERMCRVEYSEETFRGEGQGNAQHPPSECCCCMEEFGAQKVIVCTPCAHYFHYDCLKEWLKLSKTCPLCRGNLDIEPEA